MIEHGDQPTATVAPEQQALEIPTDPKEIIRLFGVRIERAGYAKLGQEVAGIYGLLLGIFRNKVAESQAVAIAEGLPWDDRIKMSYDEMSYDEMSYDEMKVDKNITYLARRKDHLGIATLTLVGSSDLTGLRSAQFYAETLDQERAWFISSRLEVKMKFSEGGSRGEAKIDNYTPNEKMIETKTSTRVRFQTASTTSI